MMGPSHAITGASAWVLLTSSATVPISIVRDAAISASSSMPAGVQQAVAALPTHMPLGLGLLEISPWSVASGAIVTAGAALLPDADHHNATIAHSLPPISEKLCRALSLMFGGHRKGTHSLVGVAFFTAVAFAASFLSEILAAGLRTAGLERAAGVVEPLQIGPAIIATLLVTFAAKALHILPDSARRMAWGIGLGAGAFVLFAGADNNVWFPISVALGSAVHILGDQLTNDGVNWLWPVRIHPPKAWSSTPVLNKLWQKDGDQAIPILGRVGSPAEKAIATVASIHAVLGIGLALYAGTTSMTLT